MFGILGVLCVTIICIALLLWPKKADAPVYNDVWRKEWSEFLLKTVSFYHNLDDNNRVIFEKRTLLFLHSTVVEGAETVIVTDEDRLLVASSAIIPVWAFPDWRYFNLKSVYLLPATFDEQFQCGGSLARFSGMVGTGPMAGKMVLSQPHLHHGFLNSRDKQNVGVHEFVHLIDMADGQCDGFPERLSDYAYAIPWLEFVRSKMDAILEGDSNIRHYGASKPEEFFTVASEYFFERPRMLKKKHPELCKALEKFYQQNVEEIANDKLYKKNSPCPCGSGKKYKRCCITL